MKRSLGALRTSSLIVCLLPLLCAVGVLRSEPVVNPKQRDSAVWGGDHVGKPLPQLTSGDECLFCHRNDIGPRWKNNRHNTTIREVGEARADGTQFAMGSGKRTRYLKRGEGYGKLSLLDEHGTWDVTKFGASCAGCHASAVDSKAQTLATVAIECYMCHGVVPVKHATERGTALLASARPFGRTRKDDPRVVVAICGSCHVRGGKSKSSGRPYPNNFVAGDNLFRDFAVDFSEAALKRMHAAEAHVVENVRDVAVLGKEDVTCLSCHEVHTHSSAKHHRLRRGKTCVQCHDVRSLKLKYDSSSLHSATCEY